MQRFIAVIRQWGVTVPRDKKTVQVGVFITHGNIATAAEIAENDFQRYSNSAAICTRIMPVDKRGFTAWKHGENSKVTV